jgi:outer membrane protein assembly factor BamD
MKLARVARVMIGMIRLRTNCGMPTRITLALLLLLVTGCGARQENLALLPPDDMFARATSEYEARRYDRAINLLEFFVSQYLGDERAPEARMMLAESHMARREYVTAAMHYQRMVNDFPFHPRALEARFQTCEAYQRLSPRPALDQQYTISAIIHCESVAENFPATPEAEQAREYIGELRLKLARKSYDTAMQYFRRRAYDAAVVYFQEVVERFPDTEIAPTALEQLIETYERIGYVEDAEDARQQLLREYPQSPEAQALRA